MPLGIEEVQHFVRQLDLLPSLAPFVHVQYAWFTSQHCALAARQHTLFVPPPLTPVEVVLLQQ